MSNPVERTLRLVFPQWQGGNNSAYHLGSQLLSWLAPPTDGPIEEVAVALPTSAPLQTESGIVARSTLLAQMHEARRRIERHRPDKLVVLGGDCLVDLAPFAYLNERYKGDLALLWVDAHPDIMTPAQFSHAHAMVLGNLLGHGDPDFVAGVSLPFKPANVLYVGVNDPTSWEASEMEHLQLQNVSPDEVRRAGSQQILEWFASTGAKHLAIHFDLDVLDPAAFRSVLFADPQASEEKFDGIARGQLTIRQVVSLLADVANTADVVGIGITEHMPWEAIALKEMLTQLPLIGSTSSTR